MSRPDPTDLTGPTGSRAEMDATRSSSDPLKSSESSFDDNLQLARESRRHLEQTAGALVPESGGAASDGAIDLGIAASSGLAPDLALDLVLNEIVEQARLATIATGAAIALFRGNELVCRATSGDTAPELGVRLNANSGLSGACVRLREVQRCDDSETDSRVDAMACRSLGLRSILIVPVVAGEMLLGVFEIFSPRPKAFGDRDVQTVQALCRRIISNVQHAVRRAAPSAVSSAASPAESAPVFTSSFTSLQEEFKEEVKEIVVPVEVRPDPVEAAAASHDYWSAILTTVVVTLAVLLGWMVGRAGWRSAPITGTAAVTTPHAANNTPPLQLDGEKPGTDRKAAASPIEKGSQPALAPSLPLSLSLPPGSPPLLSSATSQSNHFGRVTPGALIVYERGRVIFHDAADSRGGPLPVPSEKANANLVHRVEPDYPEQARERHLQGAVVLEVIVANDGAVREVKTISGDPLLADAASDAVRQWRFKPYDEGGRGVEFQTRVTVNFKLP